MKKLLITSLAVGVLISFSTSIAEDKKDTKKEKEYPLKECVVSGEKLGDHGDAFVFKHEGREVRLCCKPCQKDFKKEPAKYLKKLDDAEKKAK